MDDTEPSDSKLAGTNVSDDSDDSVTCGQTQSWFCASADNLDPANLSAMSVPPFMCPSEAYANIFESEVIDSLCKWINEKTQVCISTTGKKKVNGVIC
ncbi:hypothetical protein E2C01_037298 [Portunus trituberculatus]|uniref:Uncharacterized protein n=1 Tax=Portunus trituberculatus TaxID=210409 RepID=A0A5B7FDT5_PORTR|nr:hypothetical protein [Portunus trituberculatus]